MDSYDLVKGCGHVVEGAGGGQRTALSTDRAGARERIVHMSIACPRPWRCAGEFSPFVAVPV